MSPRQSDARRRVVETAAEMLAQHGLNAMSIRELAKRAEAPLGSTYHHFPGGKQEVVVEAVRFAGAQVSASLDRYFQAGAVAGLRGFLTMWRGILLKSAFRIGCPVMAVAVEEPIDDDSRDALLAAERVFSNWEQKLVAFLNAQGHDRKSAFQLATLIIASLEGAIVLCRAQRKIEPFDRVAIQLESLVSKK